MHKSFIGLACLCLASLTDNGAHGVQIKFRPPPGTPYAGNDDDESMELQRKSQESDGDFADDEEIAKTKTSVPEA